MADNPGVSDPQDPLADGQQPPPPPPPPPVPKPKRLKLPKDSHPGDEWIPEFRRFLVLDHPVCEDEVADITDFIYEEYHPHHLARYARKVFYLNNTFYFEDVKALCVFFGQHAWLRDYVRSIIVDDVIDPAAIAARKGYHHLDLLADALSKMPRLKDLTVGVDEALMVRSCSRERNGLQEIVYDHHGIDMQLNLVILPAVEELRRLRIKKVKFDDFSPQHKWEYMEVSPDVWRTVAGPIPRGLLERVIAPEMMSRKDRRERKRKRGDASDDNDDFAGSSRKRARRKGTGRQAVASTEPCTTFPRFMELPKELREMIYQAAVTVDGAINPIPRPPYLLSSQRYARRKRLPLPPAPYPVCALYSVCKDAMMVAKKYYYRFNTFLFYSPMQFLAWNEHLPPVYRAQLRTLTLWYNDYEVPFPFATGRPKPEPFALVLEYVERLPNLRRLTLCMPTIKADPNCGLVDPRYMVKTYARRLRALDRKRVKILIRCPVAEATVYREYNHVQWEGQGTPRPLDAVTSAMVAGAHLAMKSCEEIQAFIRNGVVQDDNRSTSSMEAVQADSDDE